MATIDPLPQALAQSLSEFPARGERNLWLFTVAARARHVASPRKVHRFLHRVVAYMGWSDRDFSPEIDRAVRRAFNPSEPAAPAATSPRRLPSAKPSGSTRPVWPPCDEELFQRYAGSDPAFALVPLEIDSEVIIEGLYPGDALLCMGLSVRSAITQPRNLWRGLEPAMEFIVANPMSAATGLTLDGRTSYRCLGNACQSRMYQVVEFDRGTLQQQAAILSALDSPKAPLLMVVWSGGKSLHGWFDVQELSPENQQRFFASACRMGADPSLWDPCKLVRMPGGRRANGHTQSVFFLSPDVL